MSKTFKLSPSDFAFLWNECKRCFYLKIVKDIKRPSTPMPTIFIRIDSIMKDYFEHKCTSEFHESLPKGKVEFGDRWIQSKVFENKKTGNKFFIKGKTDTVVKFDNGTYGIIDFKTSKIKPGNVEKYSRQLHAYSLALEKPEVGKPHLTPVKKLGLLVVEPKSMSGDKNECSFQNSMSWQPIDKDYKNFKKFLDEMLQVLSLEEAPEPGHNCQWCNYSKHSEALTSDRDPYENYEPDWKELQALEESITQWDKNHPDWTDEDAADYYGEMQSEIARGK